MRINKKLATVLAAVTAIAVVGSMALVFRSGASPSTGDADFDGGEVVATVNGRRITKQQVYERMYAQQGAQIVDQMVNEVLIEQAAEGEGVEVSAEEVDAEVSELAEQYGGEEQLQGLLGQNNMTMQSLRQNIRLNLLVRRLLEPQIDVTEEDVRAYYDEHPDEFTQPEQIHARHILVSDREQADQLLFRIRSGESFEELAREHSEDEQTASEGGDLGFFGRGRMAEAFEEAAFSAEPGRVVGPVETQFGWHLIEVLERREGEKRSFEEVREQIREQVVNRAVQERVGPWLEQLRAGAEIQRPSDVQSP